MRLIFLIFLSLISAMPPPVAIQNVNDETEALSKYLKYQEELDPLRKKKSLLPKVVGKCHHLFIDEHSWTDIFQPHPLSYQVFEFQTMAKDETLFQGFYKQLHSIVSLLEEEKGNDPSLAQFDAIVFSFNYDHYFAAKLLKWYSKIFRSGIDFLRRKFHESKFQPQWNVISTILKHGSPCKVMHYQMKLLTESIQGSPYKTELDFKFFTFYHTLYNYTQSVLSKLNAIQEVSKSLCYVIQHVVGSPCHDALVLNALNKIHRLLHHEFKYFYYIQEEINEKRISLALVKNTLSKVLTIVSLAFHSDDRLSF